MLVQAILARIRHGKPTQQYPLAPPQPAPAAFTGAPALLADRCVPCAECAQACPTGAIQVDRSGAAPTQHYERSAVVWELHYDKCIFCSLCIAACPQEAMVATGQWELAVTSRADLVLRREKSTTVEADRREVRSIGV